jgi:hypothetical protein
MYRITIGNATGMGNSYASAEQCVREDQNAEHAEDANYRG